MFSFTYLAVYLDMDIVIITVIGLLLGSFFNVLIYRLPRGLNWVTGRSKCTCCNTILTPWELLPLLSYLIQLGKCRYCHTRISWRYFIVELIVPILLILAYFQAPGWGVSFYKMSSFYLVSVLIFFIDLETYIIPDSLTFLLVFIGIVDHVIYNQIGDLLFGVWVGGGVYLLISILAKKLYKQDCLGGGDIKLGAGIGAMWGVQMVLVTIYGSFLIGAGVGLLLIILKKKTAKDIMPFGPAIVVSSIISLSFSPLIWALIAG